MSQPFIFSAVPRNTILFKAGFRYALLWDRKPDYKQILTNLEPTFGEPNGRFHYYTTWGGGVVLKERCVAQRWFFGPKNWAASRTRSTTFQPHWVAFRNEKDRLLASMII